jgi:hypothetical protein
MCVSTEWLLFQGCNRSSGGLKILNGLITNLTIPSAILRVGGSLNSGVTIWGPQLGTDSRWKDSEDCVTGAEGKHCAGHTKC